MFVVGVLTAINCMSTKWTMKIQDIFTAAKLMALISIIAAGLYHMGSGKNEIKDTLFKKLLIVNLVGSEKRLNMSIWHRILPKQNLK